MPNLMATPASIQKMLSQVEDLRERVRALEVSYSGSDGQNGLRSEVRELRKTVQIIYDKLQNLHIQLATYLGGAVVIVWIIDKFLSKWVF